RHGLTAQRSLTALLHVALHEVLGVALQDVIDLVEEVVELGLDLLPLLGRRGRLLDDLVLPCRGWLLLQLSLGHVPCTSLRAGAYWPRRARTSAAVSHSVINLPTCASVPRVGSIIGTRRSGSPPMSNTTESQFAATICDGHRCRHFPRNQARVSDGGSE